MSVDTFFLVRQYIFHCHECHNSYLGILFSLDLMTNNNGELISLSDSVIFLDARMDLFLVRYLRCNII